MDKLLEHATDTGAGFVLVVPPIVIGAGWFLLLRHGGDVFAVAPVMVVAVNAVMAMPFAIRAIRPAHDAASERHERLCAQLGISGWNRLRLIDWPSLRRPLATAFAFAMALSLGDLGVIALFGSDAVQTLPYLLLGAHGQLPHRRRRRPRPAARPRLPRADGRSPTGSERNHAMNCARRTRRHGRPARQGRLQLWRDAACASTWRSRRRPSPPIMGPSGVGQVDLAQSDRRLRDAARRPRADRRRRCHGRCPPSARPVSMVFQENNLFAHLDVEQNVGLGRSPRCG